MRTTEGANKCCRGELTAVVEHHLRYWLQSFLTHSGNLTKRVAAFCGRALLREHTAKGFTPAAPIFWIHPGYILVPYVLDAIAPNTKQSLGAYSFLRGVNNERS